MKANWGKCNTSPSDRQGRPARSCPS